jgi:hypothetical protein
VLLNKENIVLQNPISCYVNPVCGVPHIVISCGCLRIVLVPFALMELSQVFQYSLTNMH